MNGTENKAEHIQPLGAKMKAIRESFDLTIQQLANQVHVSSLTIRNWESLEHSKYKDFSPSAGDALKEAQDWLKELQLKRKREIDECFHEVQQQPWKADEYRIVSFIYFRSQKEYDEYRRALPLSDKRLKLEYSYEYVNIVNANTRAKAEELRRQILNCRTRFYYPDESSD